MRNSWLRSVRAAALGVWAVASAPLVASAASRLPDPASWTPAAASLIVYVDWQALVSSPPLRGLETTLPEREPGELEEFRELTGMDPWRDAWAFSFFTASSDDGGSSWGLAIYGAFDPERVLENLEAERRVRRAEHRETAIHRLGLADDSRAIAFPDSTTLLVGPVHQLRAMLDAGFGFAPSAVDGELGNTLEKLSMSETFWAVGNDAKKIPAIFARRASADPGVPLKSFVVSAKFGSDVDFEATGETTSPEEAQRLADLVNGLRAFAALQPNAQPGFLEALETLEAEALDESVEISAEIDGKFLREMLQRSVKKE